MRLRERKLGRAAGAEKVRRAERAGGVVLCMAGGLEGGRGGRIRGGERRQGRNMRGMEGREGERRRLYRTSGRGHIKGERAVGGPRWMRKRTEE